TALGRLEHDGPVRRIKPRGIGHARALILVHGGYAKVPSSIRNTLEAQRQGCAQSLNEWRIEWVSFAFTTSMIPYLAALITAVRPMGAEGAKIDAS
ncbi:MAG TPA: hypothetical protein VE860_27495, partial [Chthoniobacterales bacterium]|nr:hypothetical protein [Chthoniobacterales bacterium]